MIEIPFAIAIAVSTFMIGLVCGLVVHYRWEYMPLLFKHNKLVNIMIYMKKQGFIPLFEVEQPKVHDPTAGVREF